MQHTPEPKVQVPSSDPEESVHRQITIDLGADWRGSAEMATTDP